jgi:hypothetical protein
LFTAIRGEGGGEVHEEAYSAECVEGKFYEVRIQDRA